MAAAEGSPDHLRPLHGSGTTGVAALQGRQTFVGIERHEPYFDLCCRRIAEAAKQDTLF